MRWQTFVRSHVFYSECAHNRQTGRVRRPRVQTLLLLTNGTSHGVSRISIGRPQIKISPRVLVILDLHHGRVGCDAGVPGLRSPCLPEVRSSVGNAVIGCALPLYPQLRKKRHRARSRRLVPITDIQAVASKTIWSYCQSFSINPRACSSSAARPASCSISSIGALAVDCGEDALLCDIDWQGEIGVGARPIDQDGREAGWRPVPRMHKVHGRRSGT
jgi:hypothetical protein